MKIEEGKYYKTRGGKKLGPASLTKQQLSIDAGFIWSLGGYAYLYRDDGRNNEGPDNQLVSEWHEGPVLTKTIQEIVPGIYGNVEIGSRDNEWLPIPVSLKRSTFTAAELTDVINTLTEVREAMVGK